MAVAQGDVVLGWLVTAPEGAPAADPGRVLCDIGDQREEMRRRAAEICADAAGQLPSLFVELGDEVWGLAGTLRCKEGVGLFRGLCSLEGQQDGEDYFDLGREDALGADVVLLKQELLCAFLCRARARQVLFGAVQPLLGPGESCPFDAGAQLVLDSPAAAAEHYLELLLGRGPKERCPKACQYLQGVARDLPLARQPYLCSALEGRAGLTPDDSTLAILERLDGAGAEVPRDFRADLALAVAAKALELVQVLGLDL